MLLPEADQPEPRRPVERRRRSRHSPPEGLPVFASLQLPFTDLRGFFSSTAARLERPGWPAPEPHKNDFVRSCGPVLPRLRGGIREWAGEEVFSKASHALRFPNHLGKAVFGDDEHTAVIDRSLRHYHSDGTAARLTVDFKVILLQPDTWVSSSALTWATFLRNLLEIPMRIRLQDGPFNYVNLVDSGDLLSQHLLQATTDRSHPGSNAIEPWWFSSGSPAIVVEHPKALSALHPSHTRSIFDVAKVAVSHTWLEAGRQRCSVWFLATDLEPGLDDDAHLRRLRIHLARLHAERQCLRLILTSLRDDKLAVADNPDRLSLVQQYLNDVLRIIQRPRRFGLDQAAMFEAAQEAFGIAFEGDEASLQLMRRQVTAKVTAFIQQAQKTTTVINQVQGNQMNTTIHLGNVNVTGDFNLVTAQNIQDSFNKAADAPVAELKERLQELALEVANLVKQLPPDEAESVSRDLSALSTEAVAKKPRKKWYDLSAEGILEAAKTVAELTGPVSTAVKAVLALLAL